MKRFISLTLIASALCAAPLAAQDARECAAMDFGTKEALTIAGKNGTHTFSVEVADTEALQRCGMMFRDGVLDNEGMLFEFDSPKVATIWMKNTGIFLDILFVRPNGKVLKIEHFAKPYSLRLSSSEAPVAAVVELRGGLAQELGIKPGDVVEHTFFKTN